MKQIKFVLSAAICIICINGHAQYSMQLDSIQKNTELTLDLKLKYYPIQLDLNAGQIHHSNRPILIFNHRGMYEQYNVLVSQSQVVLPYKAYYPSNDIYYTGNNCRRDSFNPHGSKDIGSALLNGFINGIILGNKY
ncbi:hypothetical protein J1N10_03725 [Carboxylicivirga sp. A043]|uniref:hypothetical protein n=1 Tax=Carboxylicivirga litoralis TaxID=2816963 RepID=UPI0021CB1FBD|nr:hypothetical protein [Carboxylicivirga sp. A043]MCU4155069.1 hypothetical protein [Carboxylicivirga sp. A043]